VLNPRISIKSRTLREIISSLKNDALIGSVIERSNRRWKCSIESRFNVKVRTARKSSECAKRVHEVKERCDWGAIRTGCWEWTKVGPGFVRITSSFWKTAQRTLG
jgi:hypothetical protein